MHPSSNELTVQDEKQPTRQAIEAKTRSKPGKVTGKLAQAIDLMIEEGLLWDKAALQVGLTVRSMRLAMQRPHVIAHVKAAREVFRTHASTANIRRLVDLRDQNDNKAAAVSAIKVLEQLDDDAHRPGSGSARDVSPGFVIQVNVNQPVSHAAGASHGAFIEAAANDITSNQVVSAETAVMRHDRADDGDVLWIDGRSEGDRT